MLRGSLKGKKMNTFKEAVDKLTKNGGGIAGVVVAKDGDFHRFFYQEFDCSTKKELADKLKNVPDLLLAFVDENLENYETSKSDTS